MLDYSSMGCCYIYIYLGFGLVWIVRILVRLEPNIRLTWELLSCMSFNSLTKGLYVKTTFLCLMGKYLKERESTSYSQLAI